MTYMANVPVYRDISPGGSGMLIVLGIVIIGVAFLIARLVYANYKRYEYNSKRAWKVFLILGSFSIPFFLFANAVSDSDTASSIALNIQEKYSNVRVESDEITPVVPEYRKRTAKPLEVKDNKGNAYHLMATDTKEPYLVVPPGSVSPEPIERYKKQ
jgi:hypothetical protein